MSAAIVVPASGLPLPFSYDGLEPDVVESAKRYVIEIKRVQARTVREIGDRLLYLKERMPHGTFTAWLEHEAGIKPRTARNFMAAAEWMVDKPETVAVLPPTVIYALASPKAPPDIVADVVAMAKAGAVDVPTVQDRLAAFKDEQSELKRAQRRSPNLTLEKHRQLKVKRRAEIAAERDKSLAERDRRDAERPVRLQPLADQLASLGVDSITALFAAMGDWEDRAALWKLLQDKLGAALPLSGALVR